MTWHESLEASLEICDKLLASWLSAALNLPQPVALHDILSALSASAKLANARRIFAALPRPYDPIADAECDRRIFEALDRIDPDDSEEGEDAR